MSELEWSTEDEIQLFHALEGMKPVGIGKHFVFGAIGDRLSESLNRSIPRDEIRKHLRTIYNLDLLDEREPIPFPNKVQEFQLPEVEFKSLISLKIQQNTTSGGNSSESGDDKAWYNENTSLGSSGTTPLEIKTDLEIKTEPTSMNGNNSLNSSGTKGRFLSCFSLSCSFCLGEGWLNWNGIRSGRSVSRIIDLSPLLFLNCSSEEKT